MKALIIYCYIVIFGGWVLKFLHFPNDIGLFLLQIFDYLPFIFLFFLFKTKLGYRILPNYLLFWVITIIFLILSILTTIYHHGNIFYPIAHFGAIFRFAPLAVLIFFLKPTDNDIKSYFYHFKVISLILVSIGCLELIGGPSIKTFFIPLLKEYSSTNIFNESDDYSSIFGVFPNTVDYAYFLVVSYIIISNKHCNKNQFLLFIVFLILIYFSGSKAALIIFILCVSYRIESVKIIRTTFIMSVVIVSGILIYEFWDLFYWTVFIDSQASRLGYIIFTLPYFLQEVSFDTFFGTSPDRNLAHYKINSYPNAPSLTSNIDDMSSFEDEFYVAIIVYYGVVGFMLLLSIFIGMYKALSCSKWKDTSYNYNIIVKSLFTVLLIAPLFNQIIITKPFTLFFWSWIGILLTKMQCNVSKQNKHEISLLDY